MILLTNTEPQTVPVGGTVTFDRVVFHTGDAECHRGGSGAVSMRARGIYDVEFSANVGGAAAGAVQLSILVGGEPLPETEMDSVTAAAGDLENVATSTAIRNCCVGYERITVANTGDAEVTVSAPKLFVRRVA